MKADFDAQKCLGFSPAILVTWRVATGKIDARAVDRKPWFEEMRSRDADPLINVQVVQFEVYLRLQDPGENEFVSLQDRGEAFGEVAI